MASGKKTDGKALTVALYRAASSGDVAGVKAAVEAGAKIDGRPAGKPTPLIAATQAGHVPCIKELLACGADVNFRHGDQRNGETALYAAIASKQVEAARALVSAGADVNFGQAGNKNYLGQLNTCVSDAVQWYLELMDRKQGRSLRRGSADGTGPAALLQLIGEMLQAGGKLRAGMAADAARWAHLELFDLLLQHGADINEALQGNTAFSEVVTWREDDDIAAELLRRGADPYGGSHVTGSPFHCAVVAGKERAVQAIIAAGRDLNQKSSTTLPAWVSETEAMPFEKRPETTTQNHVSLWDRPMAHEATPLIVAVRCGNAPMVRLLARGGADLEMTDGKGFTALAWALKLNRPDIAEILRKAGAHETANLEGGPFQRLMSAIETGDLERVRQALASGADANGWAMDMRQHTTPLMAAARQGNAAVVRELLQAGANPNQAGREDLVDVGIAPLMLAARHGHAGAVEALLAGGAQIETRQVGALDDARDRKRGSTALHEAAAHGHARVVEILLRAGANANLASKSAGTPLAAAAESGDMETLRVLLGAGARANTRPGNFTATPLVAAAFNNDQAAVRILLASGADIHAESTDGTTALVAAASEGHTEMVKLLLNAGARTEPQAAQPFQTPLSAAAREGHEATLQVLLEAGANVNARCFDGTTPLHAAVLGQHSRMVELLLQGGADRSLKDEERQTPLSFARKLLDMYVDRPHRALKHLGFKASQAQATEAREIVRLLEKPRRGHPITE